MDFDEFRRIVKLMEENHLVEFEYEEAGKKIKLRKAEGQTVVLPAAAIPPAASRAPEARPADAAPAPPGEGMIEFKSPLVGTFYRSSKPEADPFVNVGDEINPETVLCIIEAMKVMNEIKAETHGIVREIRVKNSQAVEFGETLFVIEKK